ncbi:helix-turn-helix domain-containing protein [Actinophytocola oryzae]|uniref:helix-turn-helix domain-containing protein n=1 Tax=Actinophytocola oryzae TaxID=502181 RepID=UPI001FBB3A41|nr:helix-turn-helix transcriptional regulator [Actinophytocola oryzae]
MTLPQGRTSGATNVQEARIALGGRLRGLRVDAGLSGKELAESLSWQPSKVSKIENGKQTPSDEDIHAWTRATDREAETADLLASLHTLELQYTEWQRQLRGGLKPHQSEIAEINARTRMFRVFESTYVPGLLQTAEYARARVAQSLTVFKIPNDIHQAVQTRIQRQDVLYRPEKRFHFVLTEAVLRYRLCTPEVMLGQLDRLISMAALPNVKLGIIGFETAYVVAPAHGFWLLDDDRVMVETFSAELNLAQPQETALYSNIFDSLASVASYGRAARTIITQVIDDLSEQVPDSSD